jgi:hypothetical protein
MTVFLLSVPLMIVGVAIAVLPVLVGSARHHRSIVAGELETPESRAVEADFWHHMLGHRKVEDFAPTPDLVPDAEVIRVGVPVESLISTEPSVWRTPAHSGAQMVTSAR